MAASRLAADACGRNVQKPALVAHAVYAMNEQERATLRTFRRLFFRAREAYSRFPAAGGFGLQLSYENDTLTSNTTGPDERTVVAFAVLMRRFLNREDGLYYDRVWELCRTVAGDVLTPRVDEQVRTFIVAMRNGNLPFKYNEQEMTAEAMYEEFSKGGFFGDDEAARVFLEGLFEVPAAGAFARFLFVDYSIRGFQLMSMLFEILRRAGVLEQAPSPTPPSECIFCLGTEGGFTAEEHVIPEALGNDEILLPRGIVCDKCNSGVLSVLDQALTLFEPIAFLRVFFVPHTKSGNLPSADFGNLAIEKTAPRNLRFTAKDKTGDVQEVEELSDGWVHWKMELTGKKKFDPRLLGRALCKIGLELVALEEGAEAARSSRFDEVRRFVMADDGFANNLLMRTVGTPDPRVSVTRHPSLPGAIFLFYIYGVVLMVNLEAAPVLELRPELAAADFISYSLAPQGARVTSAGQGSP